MRELIRIQKRENLNKVYAVDEKAPKMNANHEYKIELPDELGSVNINFQHGPRKDHNSTNGIIDSDLLEIVRDRLTGFQSGDFPSKYNAKALEHLEIALMYLNRRVEDRIERNVLGTYEK